MSERLAKKDLLRLISGWNGAYQITRTNVGIVSVNMMFFFENVTFLESEKIIETIDSKYKHPFQVEYDNNLSKLTVDFLVKKSSFSDFLTFKHILKKIDVKAII